MNRQASILFNIDSSISDTWLALQEPAAPHSYYQRLIYALLSRHIYSTEGFQILGRQLAEIARHAYSIKQIEAIDQASQLMLALPLSRELKGVARYYQAICAKRKGNFEGAHRLLEWALEEAPPQYRARVLLTTGATYQARGEIDAALSFCIAAGKAAANGDLLTLLESQWGIAVIRSMYGDHKQSLSDFERLFLPFRALSKFNPPLYYDFLNGLAVELGEVGRLDEAKAVCAITLASLYSAAYPNWAETRDELEAKRTAATPSIIAVSLPPAPARLVRPAQQGKPIGAFAFLWLARKNSVLQTSSAIALAIPLSESIPTVLDRVRFCIQPRGPPCRG